MVKELSPEPGQCSQRGVGEEVQHGSEPVCRGGFGLGQPADPSDPDNQAKNRRVEIKVYSAEKM